MKGARGTGDKGDGMPRGPMPGDVERLDQRGQNLKPGAVILKGLFNVVEHPSIVEARECFHAVVIGIPLVKCDPRNPSEWQTQRPKCHRAKPWRRRFPDRSPSDAASRPESVMAVGKTDSAVQRPFGTTA